MRWVVEGIVRVEERLGAWQAWVTLSLDGVPETLQFDYRARPTEVEVLAQAQRIADARNAEQQ